MVFNKKGFVLMETIVVISVLCVVLIMLYGSYSNLLTNVQRKSLYDNTEYIFKTNIIREYLEDKIDPNSYNSSHFTVICQNSSADLNGKCYSEDILNNDQNDLFKFLKVEAIYITNWNVNTLSNDIITVAEATTQNYIKQLDPVSRDCFRLIVMYSQENNDTNKDIYEYASLRFGDRG